ncbi:glycine cleavage system protein R [Colwellia sp. E150_009]
MSQYLVLTAMGSDRTGCVSELTKLASECGCNILDSRMAIFGQEFTFIMLLNGDNRAINKIEVRLPMVAHNLELITMMKRTSGHKTYDLVEHYQADYTGIDQPGMLKAMTAFFAARKIDISSLRSKINPQTQNMSASISIAVTQKISIDEIENDFLQLCEQFGVQGCIKEAPHNFI